MRKQEGASAATINRELALMKHAFNMALKEWNWVKENPVSKVPMEKENNKRDRWLTYEEEEKLIEQCPEWLKEITIFALNTGMRLGEILSLTWGEIDLHRQTAMVLRSKNNEKRTIPINETVQELLKSKAKVRSIKTNLVFYGKNHEQFDVSNVGKSLRVRLDKTGIINFRFHDLRHTFATRLVQNGEDLYKVQKLLGHKTPIMTQRYAHHNSESLRNSVRGLDEARKSHITILSQSAKK